MFGDKINDRESLVGALAEALDSAMEEFEVFVDLTAQTADVFIPTEISGEPNTNLDGHELVWIEKVSSREGFEIMRDFAEQYEGEVRQRLARALSGRRPFRSFKDALIEEGLCDTYYAFKDKAYRELAESRLQDADIDFVDGKIVCSEKQHVDVFACEEED